MKTINHNGKEIKLSTSFKGEIFKWDAYRYHFNIFVEYNGKKERFTFFGSVAKYEKKVNTLNEDDLISAFCCILYDVSYTYQYDLEDFCASLDYDIKEGERVYLSCCKLLDKLNDLGLSENDITELLNSETLEPYM